MEKGCTNIHFHHWGVSQTLSENIYSNVNFFKVPCWLIWNNYDDFCKELSVFRERTVWMDITTKGNH